MKGLLNGIGILDLLDGLLWHKLCAVAFFYELFEVHLPRSTVSCVMPMCSMESAILVGTSFVRISIQRWWSPQPWLVFHLSQDLMYWDSELCIAFISWCTTLGWCLALSSTILITRLITSLTCLFGWLVDLLSILLYEDSIVVLECIALCSRKDLYQSLARSNS